MFALVAYTPLQTVTAAVSLLSHRQTMLERCLLCIGSVHQCKTENHLFFMRFYVVIAFVCFNFDSIFAILFSSSLFPLDFVCLFDSLSMNITNCLCTAYTSLWYFTNFFYHFFLRFALPLSCERYSIQII